MLLLATNVDANVAECPCVANVLRTLVVVLWARRILPASIGQSSLSCRAF